MTGRSKPVATIRPRIRIMREKKILLGPGKADLLEAIDRTGTLGDAAKSLGMSYMRAWQLVKIMNDGFRRPLVETTRGGPVRGGASLTVTGKKVLALYREIEKVGLRAVASQWRRLRRLLD